MVADRRMLTRLSWALVVLAIVSAVAALLFAAGILRPPHDAEDFVDILLANRMSDEQAFPFVVIGSVATIGVYLIVAMLGLVLRAWARQSPTLDIMSMLFVVGAIVGIVAQFGNIGVGDAARPFYCDCGYKAEEVIGLDRALGVGWHMVTWLNTGAVTLLGLGAVAASRVLEVSSTWRTLSVVIAVVLVFAALLRLLASFVFVEAFDPFQVSDLLVALAAGILVPIWAVMLARGVTEPDSEPVPAAA